ncbi:TIGR02466 family protein [Hyphomonas oceanitis]|uniref:TIGR02466 family protein n=1 Tax=Hyphomonas oceanitis TaxID=81033 RepID=UPI003002E1EA
MPLQTLFPTLIRHAAIGDDPLRASLEKVCWLLEDEDEAGNDWCDSEGYDGYTSYASLDDLPERFPEIAELKAFLDSEAEAYARDLHWDMQDQTLELNGLWVNILGESGSHSGHIHPGSVISGTYYVSIPEGAGQLKFEDPRLAFMMAAPQPEDDAPEAARRFVYVTPTQGHAMFWESWLRHEVMPNRSDIPRISISFNYAVKRD